MIRWSIQLMTASMLVLKVAPLLKEQDWTFGKTKTNVAYRKLAVRNGDDGSFPASSAVDGDFKTQSRSINEDLNQWRVDLEQTFLVAMIRLYPPKHVPGYKGYSTNSFTIWSTMDDISNWPLNYTESWTEQFTVNVVSKYGVEAYLQPPEFIRTIAVSTMATLRIAELQVFTPINRVEFGEIETSSNSDHSEFMLADGNYQHPLRFSDEGNKWVKVNLSYIYSINSLEVVNCNDPGINLLTTKDEIFENEPKVEDGWTLRSLTNNTQDVKVVMSSDSIIEAKLVGLVSERVNEHLELSELVVYEHNYALGAVATQSSTLAEGDANLAIDGDIQTISGTKMEEKVWWMVYLKERIYMTGALFYVKNGDCGKVGCSKSFMDMAIIAQTAKGNITCLDVPEPLGDSFIMECKALYASALNVVGNETSVDLREVVVYGNELPAMTGIEIKVEKLNDSVLSISFPQWTVKNIGVKVPDKYWVEYGGPGDFNIRTFPHDGRGDIQLYVQDSLVSVDLEVNVKCTVDEEDCNGPIKYPTKAENENETDKTSNSAAIATALGVTAAGLFILITLGIALIVQKERKEKRAVADEAPAVQQTGLHKMKVETKMTKTLATSRPQNLSEAETPEELFMVKLNKTIKTTGEYQTSQKKPVAGREMMKTSEELTAKKSVDENMTSYVSASIKIGKHSGVDNSVSKKGTAAMSGTVATDRTFETRSFPNETISSRFDSAMARKKSKTADLAKISIESKITDTIKTSRGSKIVNTAKKSGASEVTVRVKTSKRPSSTNLTNDSKVTGLVKKIEGIRNGDDAMNSEEYNSAKQSTAAESVV